MNRMLVVAVLAAVMSLTATAEVKPKGTILLSQCGTLNKSVNVCLAKTVNSKNTYLVFTGFRYRNHELGGDYYPAKVKNASEGRVGSVDMHYSATVPVKSGRYVIEKQYVLKVTGAVRPGANRVGQLYVDGKVFGPEMTMSTIYHTMAAGE